MVFTVYSSLWSKISCIACNRSSGNFCLKFSAQFCHDIRIRRYFARLKNVAPLSSLESTELANHKKVLGPGSIGIILLCVSAERYSKQAYIENSFDFSFELLDNLYSREIR